LEIFGAFGCNRGCLKAAAITTTIKHISTRVASHALPMNLKMPPLIISDLRILRFMGAMREKNRGILSWGTTAREAGVNEWETASWRAWEAIGPG
jgi:hypothetical protein